MCSKNWRSKFHDTTATNLANWVSDHCPIILEVKERGAGSKYVSRSFSQDHYAYMWSSYETCKSIVKDVWKSYGIKRQEDPMQCFQRAAKSTLIQLKFWSKDEFDSRQRKHDKLIQ